MPSKRSPQAWSDLDSVRVFLAKADGDESMRAAALDALDMLETHHKMVFKKADVARLRRMASDLDRREQQLLQEVGPEITPRSMRATNLEDSQAIHRILDVIDRANG